MHILILNWRDIKNPAAGGAEVLTHELARRWVKKGHTVTQISSLFPDGSPFELIDGVQIIRKGKPDARALTNSVHFLAYREYKNNFQGKVDYVIDEIHGLPFFTPFFVTEKKIALICEVADDLWVKIYGPLFGGIGRLVEIFNLRFVYQRIHYLTISYSTKKALLHNGVNEKKVHVIPMGIIPPQENIPLAKSGKHSLIFVGRLSKSKGVEDAIRVLKRVRDRLPDATLSIVGRGAESYTEYLQDKVRKASLASAIKFYGYVSEVEKFRMMAQSTLLICPSIKEGYGLTIPEAAVVGTPSVAYNVQGIRDIITSEVNGVLVESDPEAMARGVIDLLEDTKRYKTIQENARVFAQKLTFEATAEKTLTFIKQHAAK